MNTDQTPTTKEKGEVMNKEWKIRSWSKGSGKTRPRIIAVCRSGYGAKRLIIDAQRGSKCHSYDLIDPDGKVWFFVPTKVDGSGEWMTNTIAKQWNSAVKELQQVKKESL